MGRGDQGGKLRVGGEEDGRMDVVGIVGRGRDLQPGGRCGPGKCEGGRHGWDNPEDDEVPAGAWGAVGGSGMGASNPEGDTVRVRAGGAAALGVTGTVNPEGDTVPDRAGVVAGGPATVTSNPEGDAAPGKVGGVVALSVVGKWEVGNTK